MSESWKFCPSCGAPIEHKIPPGDDRLRHICSRDNEIFYFNPRVVVGCVAEHKGKILMCRRAIEPRSGFWTLPAGFLELGETAAQGGLRETREEAMADVEISELFSLINVSHIGQIHMFYRATLDEPVFDAGPESAEVILMDEADIPWQQLAFPTVYLTLQHYFADRKAGRFSLHEEDLDKDSWKYMNLDMKPEKPVS